MNNRRRNNNGNGVDEDVLDFFRSDEYQRLARAHVLKLRQRQQQRQQQQQQQRGNGNGNGVDEDALDFYGSDEYQMAERAHILKLRQQRQQQQQRQRQQPKRSRYDPRHGADNDTTTTAAAVAASSTTTTTTTADMDFISTLSAEEQENYWIEHAMLESKRMLKQQQEQQQQEERRRRKAKLQEEKDAQLAAAMIISESGYSSSSSSLISNHMSMMAAATVATPPAAAPRGAVAATTTREYKYYDDDDDEYKVHEHADDDDEGDLELRRALEASREEERRRQRIVEQQQRRRQEEERQRRIEEERKRREEQERRRMRLEQLQEDEALAAATEDSERHAVSRQLQHVMNDMANEWSQTSQQERNLGSWDCPACTLTNRPYTAKCRACGTVAPSHVLVFDPLPSRIRYGLEIEMLIPHGRTDGFSLQSIAKNLTSIGPPKVRYAGYTHETMECWKIVTDSSIGENNPNEDITFELVSPVLKGEDGLDSLRALMENVRKLGIGTNASCGFHVHVDAEEDGTSPCSSLGALKRICQCFVSLENAFDLLVSLSWEDGNGAGTTTNGAAAATTNIHRHRAANSNRYCRSNRLSFGELSSRQRWEKIDSCRNKQHLITRYVNPNADRYRKLNLTNILKPNRPSTIEFRQHGGVVDVVEAEVWIRLIITFCHRASVGTSPEIKSKCLLKEGRYGVTVDDEINSLFTLLDCHGLEQYFRMERKLFINTSKKNGSDNDGNNGNNATNNNNNNNNNNNSRLANPWQCTTCSKVFATSRSLSQHCKALRH